MKKEKIQLELRGSVSEVPHEDGAFVDSAVTGAFRVKKELAYLKVVYSKADALYESAIVNAVGQKAFEDLKYYGLIEACGSIGGRRIYAI